MAFFTGIPDYKCGESKFLGPDWYAVAVCTLLPGHDSIDFPDGSRHLDQLSGEWF